MIWTGIRFLILSLLLFVNQHAFAKSPSIDVTVETDIYYYAKEIIGDKDIMAVSDFSGVNSQRDVVEFILVQQALKLGGFDAEFNFLQGNYDGRNIKLLRKGLLLTSFDTIWRSALINDDSNVFISEPVIRKGEYFAGLYTNKANLARLASMNLTHLNDISVVSSRDWHVDWITLQSFKPKQLLHESDWIVMAKTVSRGWVDVMLAPFTNQQPFQYSGPDYRIYAIPNIKIALQDSRHFVVSKHHPLGEAAFNALTKGLKILRENGTIERAYRQAGFLNSETESWRVISPN